MSLYNMDLAAWAQDQGRASHKRAWEALDIDHLTEELEDLGHSLRDAHDQHVRQEGFRMVFP